MKKRENFNKGETNCMCDFCKMTGLLVKNKNKNTKFIFKFYER